MENRLQARGVVRWPQASPQQGVEQRCDGWRGEVVRGVWKNTWNRSLQGNKRSAVLGEGHVGGHCHTASAHASYTLATFSTAAGWNVTYSQVPHREPLLVPVLFHTYRDTILYFTVLFVEQIVRHSSVHDHPCHQRPGMLSPLEREWQTDVRHCMVAGN